MTASSSFSYTAATVAALPTLASPAPPAPPHLAAWAGLAAAAFFALDELLTRALPLEAWLASLARTPLPGGPKARASLAREVTVKLVGVAHLAIQLPLAAAALGGAGGRSAFGGPPLTLSSLPPAVAAARLYAATPLSHAVVAISAGYFAWDVAALLPRLAVAGPAMLAHGGLCAALYWYGALSGSLSFYGSLFVLWEASTPAVYARWLAAETGWGPGSAVYAAAGCVMIVSFFAARVVGGAAASAAFWASAAAELGGTHPRRPGALPFLVIAGFRAANVAMTALNLWWFGRMLLGLARLMGFGKGRGGRGGRTAEVVEVGREKGRPPPAAAAASRRGGGGGKGGHEE